MGTRLRLFGRIAIAGGALLLNGGCTSGSAGSSDNDDWVCLQRESPTPSCGCENLGPDEGLFQESGQVEVDSCPAELGCCATFAGESCNCYPTQEDRSALFPDGAEPTSQCPP